MIQPQRENSGILFKNDRQREGKQDPDYSGECNIAGTEYYMNAWLKTGQTSGKKFLSFSFKLKQAKAQTQAASTGGTVQNDMNDEIPFSPEWRG